MKIQEILIENSELDEDWKKLAASGAMALGLLGAPKSIGPEPEVQQKTQHFYNPTNKYEKHMLDYANNAGIKGLELAAFMAQVKHETQNFTKFQEQPTKDKRYFTKMYDIVHNPKLAKSIGNIFRGDGERFKGRGFIQLTGRYNYEQAGKALGIPLVKQPELASDPEVSLKVAVWFWKKYVRPRIDNFSNVSSITRLIQGGTGEKSRLESRNENFEFYKKALSNHHESK